MLNVSQSLLHPDQYRFGIKSPVLLYSLSTIQFNLQLRLQATYNDFDVNQQFNQKLHFVTNITFVTQN